MKKINALSILSGFSVTELFAKKKYNINYCFKFDISVFSIIIRMSKKHK